MTSGLLVFGVRLLRARAHEVKTAASFALLELMVVAAAGHVQAADVFISTAPDGSLRYATQALDTTYRLAHREGPSPEQTPSPTEARPDARLARLRPIIERVARRHGVAPALVEAMISVESSFNPNAVSPKGAQGVMQLMPTTAAQYGLGRPNAWRDPERNIEAGVRHFKDLLAQHQGNVVLALSAYNAGSGAVARYRGRIPPYRETMLYVPSVLARSAAVRPSP